MMMMMMKLVLPMEVNAKIGCELHPLNGSRKVDSRALGLVFWKCRAYVIKLRLTSTQCPTDKPEINS